MKHIALCLHFVIVKIGSVDKTLNSEIGIVYYHNLAVKIGLIVGIRIE